MEDFNYLTDEGCRLDEIDSMKNIKSIIDDLKKDGLLHNEILENILSMDNIEGDRKRLTEFVERVLQNIIRAI